MNYKYLDAYLEGYSDYLLESILLEKKNKLIFSNVKKLENPLYLTQFSKKYIKIPMELKNFIVKYNGCRVSPNCINTKEGKEYDVNIFLSFNPDDSTNVFSVIDYFYNKKLLPFAMDSSSNYFCMKGNKVVLWTQDDDVHEVCNSFNTFLDNLHD